ncbi:hypothetical protein LTR94_030425, partial [Friedmanniomyces endolithicus]
HIFGPAPVIFRQEWSLAGAADIAAKAGGAVAVAAQPDIIGLQAVIFLELAAARSGQDIAVWHRGVIGHPEAIEVAHPIMRSAM